MGNCVIAYGNLADDAVLTAGSWRAALPLNNLKDRRIKKVARSTDATTASTQFVADLGAQVSIGALSLEGTNLSPTAQARWRTYTDAGLLTLVADTTMADVYPVGSAGAGLRPTAAQLGRVQNAARNVVATHTARYVKCEIADTTNPAGYVDIGRLFVGQTFRPTINMLANNSLGLKSRTTMDRTRDGTRYFEALRPDIVMPAELKYLTEDEAMKWFDIQALLDVHGEVLFFWDPEAVAYRYIKSMFGYLAQLDPIAQPFVDNHSTAFQVEGTL